jgi:hypothetical protein
LLYTSVQKGEAPHAIYEDDETSYGDETRLLHAHDRVPEVRAKSCRQCTVFVVLLRRFCSLLSAFSLSLSVAFGFIPHLTYVRTPMACLSNPHVL